MIRTAICDDNEPMLDFLNKKIADIFEENEMHCEINAFHSGSDFLESHAKRPFDVVFLDIRMPDVSGFDVAAELRRLNEKAYIIFVTTENSLVYDSFSFQPFDFIPKTAPSELGAENSSKFLVDRIKSVTARLLSQMTAVRTVCLPLPYNQKLTVNISDIQMIQSVRNYAEYIITEQDPVRVRAKLDDIESELDKHFFARPHKSYIINMNYIKDIDSSNMIVRLKSGMIIPISKTHKRDFEAAYINFLSGFGG